MRRKILAILIATTMMLTLMPGTVIAAQFEGLEGHWAADSLEACDSMGVLEGLVRETYSLDEKATRGDLFKMLDNIMHYPDAKGKTFKDLDVTHPYYQVLTNLNAAGIVNGYDGDLVKPDAEVTREEAIVLFGRVFGIQANARAAQGFTDYSEIGEWARDLVGGMKSLGYIHGYGDGSFAPKANMTIGELSRMIDNLLAEVISTAGTYTKNIGAGYTVVNKAGVTLKDITIEGDLIAAIGIGKGELILDNVKLKGRLLVFGGGKDSIIIRGNSELGTIIVYNGVGGVAVKVQDNADVEIIYVDDGSDDVFIEGTIGELVIGSGVNVTIRANAKVTGAKIGGDGSALTIQSTGSVGTLDIIGDSNKVVVNGTLGSGTVSGDANEISGSGQVTNKVVFKEGEENKITVPGVKVSVEAGSGAVNIGGNNLVQPGRDGTVPSSSGGDGGGGSSSTSYSITVLDSDDDAVNEYSGFASESEITSGTYAALGMYTDSDNTTWDDLSPTAEFQIGYDIKNLRSTKYVALAFKISSEDGDASTAELLALDRDTGSQEPFDDTIWNVLGNTAYPESEDYDDDVHTESEKAAFTTALKAVPTGGTAYSGYWGRVAGRPVSSAFTYAPETFRFFAPASGTYTITIDLIDFNGSDITVLASKTIMITVGELAEAGRYYKIIDGDSGETTFYLTENGERTEDIGEIGAIKDDLIVVIYDDEQLVSAAGYSETTLGEIGHDMKFDSQYNNLPFEFDENTSTLTVTIGGEGTYNYITNGEINLWNWLVGSGVTDIVNALDSDLLGDPEDSKFVFAVLGRETGISNGVDEVVTGPFFATLITEQYVNELDGVRYGGGVPVGDAGSLGYPIGYLTLTVHPQDVNFESETNPQAKAVVYVGNTPHFRTYIFDCDNGDFVFLNVSVTDPS